MQIYHRDDLYKRGDASGKLIMPADRAQFKNIISLSWMIRRNLWSLLKLKLIHNEELIIKKKAIELLLQECKHDKDLLKLIYQKKYFQMNQIDLILHSIKHLNLMALKLFIEEYNLPTNSKSIDMALEISSRQNYRDNEEQNQSFEIFQYFWDKKKDTLQCTQSELFSPNRHYNTYMLQLILDNPNLYRSDAIPENIKIELLNRGLVSSPKSVYYDEDYISKTIQQQSPYLPQSIYSYLEKNYQKNELYKHSIISVFYFFKILIEYPEKEDSLSILKDFINIAPEITVKDIIYYKTLSINPNSYKPGQKVEIIQAILSFNLELIIEIIESLFPIDSLTLESTILIFSKLKNFDNDGTKRLFLKTEIIPQSFYLLNIIKTADVELLDQFLNEFNSHSERVLIFNIADQNPLNKEYFKDCSIDDSEKIIKFIDSLSSIQEFNPSSEPFLTCLKSKLFPISKELYISSLLKFKETASKLEFRYSKVLDEVLFDFFLEKDNFKSNLASFNKFLNFKSLPISLLIEKLLITNDLEFIELLLNTIGNGGDFSMIPVEFKTSNPELIKLVISKGNWYRFFDFRNLIDTVISDSNVCNISNPNTDTQTIELIENIINFIHSNKFYQTKNIGYFGFGIVSTENNDIISNEATMIALKKKKSIKILQLLLKYKDLFYWDSQLFPKFPNLPTIQLENETLPKSEDPIISVYEKQEMDAHILHVSRIKKSKYKNCRGYGNSSNSTSNNVSLIVNAGISSAGFGGYCNDINNDKKKKNPNIIDKFKTNQAEIIFETIDMVFTKNHPDSKVSSKEYILKSLIYCSIKYRRINIFERLITTQMFTETNQAEIIYSDFLTELIKKDNGVDLIAFKYLISTRFLQKFSAKFLQTKFQQLFICAVSECCFHLCEWLLSTDNPYNEYFDFSKTTYISNIEEKLLQSRSPVFKEYMINKIKPFIKY
ncbi:hypothetical protein ACTFIU_003226 [Dictyostelium citrinum]